MSCLPSALAVLGSHGLLLLLTAFSGSLPSSARENLRGSVSLIPGGQVPAGPPYGPLADCVRARPTSGPVSGREIGSLGSEYGDKKPGERTAGKAGT